MWHIVSCWLTAACLVAAMGAKAAAAEPASSKREWNIQIHPGPAASHRSAVSPLVSDGTTSRDPIVSSDQPTGSNSLSENLARGGRFYFGRGNRFADSADGTTGIGSGKTTTDGAPSLTANDTPGPSASKLSPLRNHRRLAHSGSSGSRKQNILRDSYFVGHGHHRMGHKDGVLRDSHFIHGGGRSLGGPAIGGHVGGGPGGGGSGGHVGGGHIGGGHAGGGHGGGKH